MSDGLLFEVSPIEDEDSKKKKPAKRKKAEDEDVGPKPEQIDHWAFYQPGFLAPIDGQAPCERCGMTLTDLMEVRRIDGTTKWIVICGWGCMARWEIDPIPGILDQADREAKQFVLREGRFSGKTFDQVWADGGEWYIRDLVKMAKRSTVSRAAAEWLAKKIG